MTVKELIQELLEYEMDSEVELRIKLHDMDLDYKEFTVETEKLGGGWGREQAVIAVDLEHQTSQEFVDDIGKD